MPDKQRVTLDTNCIYEIEGAGSSPLHRLVEALRSGLLFLQVSAIASSERQRGGGSVEDFDHFRERLANAGLAEATLLRPMAYADICYYDWSVWSGPELEAEELRIHEILFPKVALDADDYCLADDEDGRRKWRNNKCDVQSLWCHIYYGGDIFVTRDGNFHKESKKSRLEELGARLIATPEEAVRVLGL